MLELWRIGQNVVFGMRRQRQGSGLNRFIQPDAILLAMRG